MLKQALRRGCAEVLFEAACQAYRRGEVTLSRAAEMTFTAEPVDAETAPTHF